MFLSLAATAGSMGSIGSFQGLPRMTMMPFWEGQERTGIQFRGLKNPTSPLGDKWFRVRVESISTLPSNPFLPNFLGGGV